MNINAFLEISFYSTVVMCIIVFIIGLQLNTKANQLKKEKEEAIDEDGWDSIMNEFRETEEYKKSGGQLLFPKFFDWLSNNYESPDKK